MLLTLWMVYPADVPWINDEPKLIEKALHLNEGVTTQADGLAGHLGVAYGSLPVRFYQLGLKLTHEVVWLVTLKTLLSFLTILLSLLWIAKNTSLALPPVLIPLASPYLFFYGRLLWDNCFLVALSVACIAAFVSFLTRPRLAPFLATLLFGVAMVETHLMCAYLVVPLGVCLVGMRWRWLLAHWWKAAVALGVTFFFVWPHLTAILQSPLGYEKIPTALPTKIGAALSAADFMTFHSFADYFIPEFVSHNPWLPSAAMKALVALTLSIQVVMAIGVLEMSRRAIVRISVWRSWGARARLGVLCAAVVAATVAAFWWADLTALYEHPHYVNAVWFPGFFCYWWMVSWHWSRRPVRVVVYGQVGLMTGLLLLLVAFVHVNGGNRGLHYGATLGNQIAVARQLNLHRPGMPVQFLAENQRNHQHALRFLRELYAIPDSVGRDRNLPVVDYVDPEGATTGFIEVQLPYRAPDPPP